jgi:hypothetical protein
MKRAYEWREAKQLLMSSFNAKYGTIQANIENKIRVGYGDYCKLMRAKKELSALLNGKRHKTRMANIIEFIQKLNPTEVEIDTLQAS